MPLVHQIYLSDHPIHPLPERIRAAMDTVRHRYGNENVSLHGLSDLRHWIGQNFPGRIRAAFDCLRPYSFKANVGRYCLLYAFGGWYFDSTIRCNRRHDPDAATDMVLFHDLQRNVSSGMDCAVGCMYSKPRNPLLMLALEEIVHNCHVGFYGPNPLFVSGPALFGKVMMENQRKWQEDMRIQWGHFRESAEGTRAFWLEGSTDPLAYGKDAQGGDLTTLGCSGVNNYNALWAARQVYSS